MRRIEFVNEQFYHIYNRGVEKRRIFLDNKDYLRFIHCLYEFNNQESNHNFSRSFEKGETSLLSKAKPYSISSQTLLVDILCFCLMPNHFHLLLRQNCDNAITNFMHKLGTGYTMYFNKRNERSGVLFQGVFRATLIESDEYLMHLSRYIHLNPVELIDAHWQEEGIKDWGKVNDFLGKYRWSSYLDYLGRKNFPSVIKREFLQGYFKSPADYQKFVNGWLTKDREIIGDLILEIE